MKDNKKKIIVTGVLILLVVITLLGSSYALWSVSVKGSKTQTLRSGTLELKIENEASSGITLTNAYPMTYQEGMATTAYTFSLHNTGNLDARYELKAIDGAVTGTRLADNKVRYSLIKNGTETTGLFQRTLETSIIKAGATNTYTLRIWIDYAATKEIQGQQFNVKLQISSLVDTTTEGPNAPDLAEGLIPVKWNGTDWVTADASNSSANPWYNYDEQMWANAVTTTATNRTTYMNATPGTVIPMSDINTMWVWIPRYEYRYDNLATQYAGGTAALPGAIDIHFISKDITGATMDNYYVHPAFNFGTDQLAGIWVGKFETGNQTSCSTSQNDAGTTACDLTTLGVQIKPNVSSWRGIRVSTMFTVSREMSNSGNAYGLNMNTTDSHMMKNTEWGAVAYLSQSAYGKYANSAYTGANKEVYVNNYFNNYLTLTGCSAGVPSTDRSTSCAYTYEKSNTGTGASTTGNIYGVYDMSGGATEYVMGNMKASGNQVQLSGYQNMNNQNSGFTGINYNGTQVMDRPYPNPKYYDAYNYSTSNRDYSSRYIKGDATYEVSRWYSDTDLFANTSFPWFHRGGRYGDPAGTAGVFSFNSNWGSTDNGNSFRLVLSVTA